MRNLIGGSTLLLLLCGPSLMADDATTVLFDFNKTVSAKQWRNINDGVMGGVSEGKFKITDKKTLLFYGTLSLENNGGFASVRSNPKKLALKKGDALFVRLRGDGSSFVYHTTFFRAHV